MLEPNNSLKDQPSTSNSSPIQISSQDPKEDQINIIDRINFQKCYILISLKIGNDFRLNTVDRDDQNCIRERLIPSIFYEKKNRKII